METVGNCYWRECANSVIIWTKQPYIAVCLLLNMKDVVVQNGAEEIEKLNKYLNPGLGKSQV